jgi:hypothetical protein
MKRIKGKLVIVGYGKPKAPGGNEGGGGEGMQRVGRGYQGKLTNYITGFV